VDRRLEETVSQDRPHGPNVSCDRRDKHKQQIPMRPKSFLQIQMKPLAEKLGIDRRLITFQVLRRTFGTTMQKHGSMKDVQAHLRHASITTTGNIYVQEIPETVRAAVNATTNEILGLSGKQAEQENQGSEAYVPNCSLSESSEAA
jgi:integrase